MWEPSKRYWDEETRGLEVDRYGLIFFMESADVQISLKVQNT